HRAHSNANHSNVIRNLETILPFLRILNHFWNTKREIGSLSLSRQKLRYIDLDVVCMVAAAGEFHPGIVLQSEGFDDWCLCPRIYSMLNYLAAIAEYHDRVCHWKLGWIRVVSFKIWHQLKDNCNFCRRL